MLELVINGQVYEFNFGMGFMREINKTIKAPIDGTKNAERNVGLQYHIAGILDGDIEYLINLLVCANKGKNPRVTPQLLDAYIDDADTDVEALFDEVLDFLKSANATKKVTLNLLEMVEKKKAEI